MTRDTRTPRPPGCTGPLRCSESDSAPVWRPAAAAAGRNRRGPGPGGTTSNGLAWRDCGMVQAERKPDRTSYLRAASLRVVMDNVALHRTLAVRDALEKLGVSEPEFPAYSPDLNPIEPAIATLTAFLRKLALRSPQSLTAALRDALQQLAPAECAAYLRSCRLRLPCPTLLRSRATAAHHGKKCRPVQLAGLRARQRGECAGNACRAHLPPQHAAARQSRPCWRQGRPRRGTDQAGGPRRGGGASQPAASAYAMRAMSPARRAAVSTCGVPGI